METHQLFPGRKRFVAPPQALLRLGQRAQGLQRGRLGVSRRLQHLDGIIGSPQRGINIGERKQTSPVGSIRAACSYKRRARSPPRRLP
jgi:hypothetical protein